MRYARLNSIRWGFWKRVVSYTVLILLTVFPSQAQQHIAIHHVRVDADNLQASFTVSCDGQPVTQVTPQQIELTEDGLPIRQFSLRVPGQVQEPVSAVLLFDASGSMAGAPIQAAKAAGMNFVSMMNGSSDSAVIAWFNEDTELAQPMTNNKSLLQNALASMPAGGGTAIFDACFIAMQQFDGKPMSMNRSLIVLSDGADNSSMFTSEAVYQEALRLGVHINVVSLGAGWGNLSMLPTLTNGKYYSTHNPDDLVDIYAEIFHELRNGYGECHLTWKRRTCDDGAEHEVRLGVDIPCRSTYTAASTFRAPFDSTVFVPLSMHLGNGFMQGGSETTLTLWLDTPVDSVLLYSFSFELQFDTSQARLTRVEAPPGTLLSGMTISHHPYSGGVVVTASGVKYLHGSGAFADVTFFVHPVQDTVSLPIRVKEFDFEEGCLHASVFDGRIDIYPPGPIPLIACEMYAPAVLQWDRNSGDYSPNPFPVMARFPNAGGVTATNARFVLSYDRNQLVRVQPHDDTIAYASSDITPGSHAAVSWDMWTPRLLQDESTDVTITGLFDNHPPVICTARIGIPRADAVLQCELTVPEFWVDRVRGRFGPMPFPVTATIRNVGGRDAENIVAGIVLADSLSLAAEDAPDRYQKATIPDRLSPGDSATVSWMLEHPTVQRPASPIVQVIVQSPNTGASSCSAALQIPDLDVTAFSFTLIHTGSALLCEGDSLVLDASSGRDSWRWNTGDSTRRIVVRSAGSYYCVVQVGDRSGYSDTVHVVMHPAPRPVITVEGSLPLCANDTLTLDAGEGYATYAWNSGAKTRRISVRYPGTYWVEVRDQAGCRGTSDTVDVRVVPQPRKPLIQRMDDRLIADSTGSLQWLHDGHPMAGETAAILILQYTGSYRVRVTDENGCTALSDAFEVRVLDVPALLPSTVRLFDVYPNPTTGKLSVILLPQSPSHVRLRLTDLLGRVVREQTHWRSGVLRATIDMASLPPGPYLLRVEMDAATVGKVVVKE